MSSVLKRYCISVGFGLLLFILVIVNHGLFSAETLKDKIRILSDACTIPGTVLLMLGFLCMIANKGTFMALGYAFKNIARIIIPGAGLREKGTYYDYVSEQKEKKPMSFGFLTISGICFLAIAVVLIVVYYNIK